MGCALAAVPPPDQISPDTPLRLGIAAALVFLDGSMTAAGREDFMLDPIPERDLAGMWAELGHRARRAPAPH